MSVCQFDIAWNRLVDFFFFHAETTGYIVDAFVGVRAAICRQHRWMKAIALDILASSSIVWCCSVGNPLGNCAGGHLAPKVCFENV